jgi:hypothetical protein
MDLNLDHYSLTDILNLFKLPENFTLEQLKQARKKVVSVHPDKSGLDKSYFLFFYNAYTLLETIHKFNQKAIQNMSKPVSFEDILAGMEDTDKKIIANQFTKNPSFNKEFNALFETLYIRDDDGHGDWLKSDADLDCSYQDRKQSSRSIVVSGISPANTPMENDLKSMYTTHCVIGVSEEDYRSGPNLEELKQSRSNTITPLTRTEAEKILAMDHERESALATERTFRLLQQEKMNSVQQNKFWSKLMSLTN